jgi:glyoxylase-like metal-dependent hydrolase (beta-lactamase superfamily II)
MRAPPRIVPIANPMGHGSTTYTYVYYVDAPEPALIDTGSVDAPRSTIAEGLRAIGVRLADIRWILLTHAHWDHVGGAEEIRAAGGGRTALHPRDFPLLRDRDLHLNGYAGARFRYVDDPEERAKTESVLLRNISGTLEIDRELTDGDRVNLGGETELTIVETPGHSPGSVTFVLESAGWGFTGDAVQANGGRGPRFPAFVDAAAYRDSLLRLRDLRLRRAFMGHPQLGRGEQVFDPDLDEAGFNDALAVSLEAHASIAEAARAVPDTALRTLDVTGFAAAAAALGYDPNAPRTWPKSFIPTVEHAAAQLQGLTLEGGALRAGVHG